MVSNGSPPPLPTDLKKAFDAKQFNKTNMGPCHVSMHANLPRKRIDKAPILLYKFSSLKLEAARNKKDKVRLRLFFSRKICNYEFHNRTIYFCVSLLLFLDRSDVGSVSFRWAPTI